VNFDLEAVTDAELDLRNVPFVLCPRENKFAAAPDATLVIDALVLSFDTTFNGDNGKKTVLDTSVTAPSTHWAQTCLWLFHDKGDGVTLRRGERMEGRFSMVRGKENQREMEIEVHWTVAGANGVNKSEGKIKTRVGTS